MPALMEISWIFISASAFNLLQYIALVEVYEEKQASHRYMVGKGRSILIVLLGNFGYSSSKILNQKSTRKSFLKVSCNGDSEIVSLNFSYSVSLKPIDLSWSFEKYWFTDLCLSYQCWQISLYNIKKSTFTYTTTEWISQVSKTWETAKVMAVDASFPEL